MLPTPLESKAFFYVLHCNLFAKNIVFIRFFRVSRHLNRDKIPYATLFKGKWQDNRFIFHVKQRDLRKGDKG